MKKALLFVATLLLLVSCGDKKGSSSSDVTGVALTPTSMNLVQGETKRLSVTYTPTSATGTLNWTSSDETIATVDEKGIVTAANFATGDVVITATLASDASISATCAVKVVTFAENITWESCVMWDIEKDYAAGSQEGDTIGLAHLRLFSNGLFVNASGYVDGNSGVVIDMYTPFRYDAQYYYVLGAYAITDTPYVAGSQTIMKEHNALAATFNSGIYLDYMTALLNKEEPDAADYPYVTGTEAHMLEAAEDGEGYYSMFTGYVTNATFSVDKDASGSFSWLFDYYDITATMLTGYYGLATELGIDEETGEQGLYIKDPLEISSQEFHYVKSEEAAAPSVALNQRRGINRADADHQMRVVRAMNVALDAKMNTYKLFKK